MGKIIRNDVVYSGTCDNATNINYNNSVSGLSAKTVQEGIDELTDSLVNLETTESGTIADGFTYTVRNNVVTISVFVNNYNITSATSHVVGSVPQHLAPNITVHGVIAENGANHKITILSVDKNGVVKLNGWMLSGAVNLFGAVTYVS